MCVTQGVRCECTRRVLWRCHPNRTSSRTIATKFGTDGRLSVDISLREAALSCYTYWGRRGRRMSQSSLISNTRMTSKIRTHAIGCVHIIRDATLLPFTDNDVSLCARPADRSTFVKPRYGRATPKRPERIPIESAQCFGVVVVRVEITTPSCSRLVCVTSRRLPHCGNIALTWNTLETCAVWRSLLTWLRLPPTTATWSPVARKLNTNFVAGNITHVRTSLFFCECYALIRCMLRRHDFSCCTSRFCSRMLYIENASFAGCI